MKLTNGTKIRIVFVGLVAAMVFCSRSAKADFTFGEPVNLGPGINRGMQDMGASLSSDGLSLFFCSRRSGGLNGYDIWVTARATVNDDWGEPVKLGPAVNRADQSEWDPSISSDGLELYFSRGPSNKNHDLYVTTRKTTNDEWSTAVSLGETINSSAEDWDPCISTDGLSLYFTSTRTGGEGGRDLYVTTRLTKNDAWSTPVNLGPTINSSTDDMAPSITSDGLTLIFSSKRPGKYSNNYNLWMTKRRTTSDPWREPINLGPVINTGDLDYADISPDGQTLYIYCWNWPGGYGFYDIWQTSIIPIVDFDGDGTVDVKDVIIMTEHWGENYLLCDIGPSPLGDGIVDVLDLEALIEYIEPIDRTPIAHWPLDETEGMLAADSVGGNDAVVVGGTEWLPNGGQIDGALKLDGASGYAITGEVLNPVDGPFSIFVWINGGAPGQVIISQTDGDGAGGTWLGADVLGGNLTTGLVPKKIGWITPQPLVSEFVITDGQWHHVGFVWDGSYRALYVDGIEVAKDINAQNPLKNSDGGLCIGVNKNLDAGTFFSGLIDDVRIYNRVVSP